MSNGDPRRSILFPWFIKLSLLCKCFDTYSIYRYYFDTYTRVTNNGKIHISKREIKTSETIISRARAVYSFKFLHTALHDKLYLYSGVMWFHDLPFAINTSCYSLEPYIFWMHMSLTSMKCVYKVVFSGCTAILNRHLLMDVVWVWLPDLSAALRGHWCANNWKDLVLRKHSLCFVL